MTLAGLSQTQSNVSLTGDLPNWGREFSDQVAVATGAPGRTGGDGQLSGVDGTSAIAQARGNPNPIAPDGYFLGAGAGALVPDGWRGGAFVIMPPGNSPLDFTTEDGTPPNTIFVSKNLARGNVGDLFKYARQGVGTYNTTTGELELGYGGSIVVNGPGNVPILGFLNARANPPENFTGTISANFGVGFSLDQSAALALSGIGAAASTVPVPQVQAGARGAQAVAGFLRGLGQVGNAYAGVGYRVELRFREGQLDGIYYKGQRIVDLEQFMRDSVAGANRYRPPVIPNGGSPVIANFNYTNQLIFGTSPWDLAATSGGSNHGNGAVGVANSWRQTIQAYGQRYYDQLPDDVRQTVVLGPRSMADAGRAVNALLAVASDGDAGLIMQGLENRYDLDFGVPGVKLGNQLRNNPANRPGDYGFVRNAFEGDYRWPVDNPNRPATGGGFRL